MMIVARDDMRGSLKQTNAWSLSKDHKDPELEQLDQL